MAEDAIAELERLAGAFSASHPSQRIQTDRSDGDGEVTLLADYDAFARAERPAVSSYRALGPERAALRTIRPMRIKLTREDSQDRANKAGGYAVELETGDKSFDDVVYVDSLTPADVLLAVLDADARGAIVRLLDHGTRVEIDDMFGRVAVSVPSAVRLTDASRTFEAFCRLLDALPVIEGVPGKRDHGLPYEDAWGFGCIGTLAAIVVAPGVYFGVAGLVWPSAMSSPMVMVPFASGIVGGFGSAFLARRWLRRPLMRRVGQRSDTGTHARAVEDLVFVAVAVIVFFLVALGGLMLVR